MISLFYLTKLTNSGKVIVFRQSIKVQIQGTQSLRNDTYVLYFEAAKAEA